MFGRLTLDEFRGPLIAGASYAIAILVLLALGAASCLGLWRAYADYSASVALRDELRSRKGLAGLHFTTEPPAGSPYIEASTATVAGATLQQRVDALIAEAGGSVASSELELQDQGADSGRIGLVVACDIDQDGLQRVLYELESGMPVLFVRRLAIQAVQADGQADGQAEGQARPVRIRAQIGLSGQWRPAP